jgi:membrane carboxypeptidase/penicillin-binding protein PbpC
VKDPDGKTLEKWEQPEPKEVIDAQPIRLLNEVLSANIGLHVGLGLPDRPVALKTGTTSDYRDGWIAGYTPNLVTVVWGGNNDNSEMARGAGGSTIAAPIWQSYMKRVTPGMPVEQFTSPARPETKKPALLGTAFKKTVTVNHLTGKLASEFTPPELREEREGYEAHSILYYVDKNDPLGPPPGNPARDEQFNNWEGAVRAWVERTQWNATSTIPTETDDQYTEENRPTIQIESPQENENITLRRFTVRTNASAPRGVHRVEAYLDGILVGTTFQTPWNIQVTVPNSIAKGFRTLKVRAYDDIGNWNEAAVNINFLAEVDDSLNQLFILSPSNGTVWSRSTFPNRVELRMEDPSAYERIEARLLSDSGGEILIGVINNPANNIETIGLPTGPIPGEYTLQIISIKRADGLNEIDEVSMSIIN